MRFFGAETFLCLEDGGERPGGRLACLLVCLDACMRGVKADGAMLAIALRRPRLRGVRFGG